MAVPAANRTRRFRAIVGRALLGATTCDPAVFDCKGESGSRAAAVLVRCTIFASIFEARALKLPSDVRRSGVRTNRFMEPPDAPGTDSPWTPSNSSTRPRGAD